MGGDLTEGFLRYRFGGLIFGGAYTWRGLLSEFYGMLERVQALYTTYPFSMQPSLNFPTTRLNKYQDHLMAGYVILLMGTDFMLLT